MKMSKKRWLTVSGLAALVAILIWQSVAAEAPIVGSPAHIQVKQILTSLRDSEAESADGAYFPGVGAFVTLTLLRGPNSVKGKTAYDGTRDWMIYLMQTFGPKLAAVPPTETIGMSVDFYDYDLQVYHQLVMTAHASDIADPSKYQVTLDGQAYDVAAAQMAAAAQATGVPTQPQPTTVPQATSAVAGPTATAAPPATAAPTLAPTPSGPLNLTANFDDPQAAAAQWTPGSGKWNFADAGYAQTELGTFDRFSYFSQKLTGDYRLEVRVKYLEGDMGAGLIFNAPTAGSKNNAQMVSYAGKGSYFQWGHFDEGGVFQFQGGGSVANGADGAWHTLAIRVTGQTYNVSLDGTALAQNAALSSTGGGYVGVFANTSHVLFDDFKISQTQP